MDEPLQFIVIVTLRGKEVDRKAPVGLDALQRTLTDLSMAWFFYDGRCKEIQISVTAK
jgi:hypothetical protein